MVEARELLEGVDVCGGCEDGVDLEVDLEVDLDLGLEREDLAGESSSLFCQTLGTVEAVEGSVNVCEGRGRREGTLSMSGTSVEESVEG